MPTRDGRPARDSEVEPGVRFLPSNVGSRVPLEGERVALELEPRETVVIDTDSGEVRSLQAGQRDGIELEALPIDVGEIAVFALERLRVPEGATLVGRGARPLVLLVEHEAIIDGTLSVGADVIDGDPGPGAGGGEARDDMIITGPGAGVPGRSSGGGGGGGNGSAGARGGATGGGEGGAAYGEASLVPLLGGSPGGRGALSGGLGGHGGGALQLVAGESIEVRGVIDASGGGGRGCPAGRDGGGGGGGSGGAILLEAPELHVRGAVVANGGSGGQGAPCSSCAGADGRRGTHLEIPVTSVPGGRSGGGGGSGSDASGHASEGGDLSNGGGGGGGAGRVHLRIVGSPAEFAGISPSLSSGLASVTEITILP